MLNILVLFYSRYGATKALAENIANGIEQLDNITAKLRTVPPVAAEIEKTLAPIPKEGLPYVTPDDIKDCAGIALGSPTRFGNMAAPMKYFWDTTGGLWSEGALIDKPAIVFTSSSSLHGGQETTLISMMIPLIHHGAIILGTPYSEKELATTKTGGTPYGPSHVTFNKNDSKLSSEEKILAFNTGKRLARTALRLNKS